MSHHSGLKYNKDNSTKPALVRRKVVGRGHISMRSPTHISMARSPALRGHKSMRSPTLRGHTSMRSPTLRGHISMARSSTLRGHISTTRPPILRGHISTTRSPTLRGHISTTRSPTLRGHTSTTRSPTLRGHTTTITKQYTSYFPSCSYGFISMRLAASSLMEEGLTSASLITLLSISQRVLWKVIVQTVCFV